MCFILIIELLMIYIFLNMLELMLMVIIILGFFGITWLSREYIILVILSWPILVYLIVIMSSNLNRVKLGLMIKIMYGMLFRLILMLIMLCYILVMMVGGVIVLYILGRYLGYWMLGVNLLMMSLVRYLLVEKKLIWIGVLPYLIFYIKQNLVIVIFMIKIIWYW
jgi:hypothetical protein